MSAKFYEMGAQSRVFLLRLRSPVWVRMCLFRSEGLSNFLGHVSHGHHVRSRPLRVGAPSENSREGTSGIGVVVETKGHGSTSKPFKNKKEKRKN